MIPYDERYVLKSDRGEKSVTRSGLSQTTSEEKEVCPKTRFRFFFHMRRTLKGAGRNFQKTPQIIILPFWQTFLNFGRF